MWRIQNGQKTNRPGKGKFGKLISLMIRKGRNRKNYILNEMKFRFRRGGDTRDEFEKVVQKCRILELERMIYNAHGGEGA